jgi:glycosyltransferase involved in cell wall biosynthesis
MKILIVSQYFWPEGFRINALVKSLVERGIEVDVLTGKPNYPEGNIYKGYKAWGIKLESWYGANIYRVPLFPRGNKNVIYLALNYLSFMLSGCFFGPWLLRNKKYDIVFAYSLSPILLAIPGILMSRIKRTPFILWLQDLWPESLSATGNIKNSFVLKIVSWVVAWIYRRSDLILIQSHAFKKAVERITPDRKLEYYPNSVDPSFALPPDPQIKLPSVKAFDSGFSVVFAGNVGVAQSVETLVAAANILRDYDQIHFVIFGKGSRWEWLKNEVGRCQLNNVHLLGQFPEETMPGLLQQAGALLVTLTDQPIFALTVPNKIQAYMAAGRPILACLNGEGARLVEDANAGLVIAAEDGSGLAHAVLRLYQMPANERDVLGVNGRNYFYQHFDHEILVDSLISTMKQVQKAKVN